MNRCFAQTGHFWQNTGPAIFCTGVNGDAGVVANSILTFLPNVVSTVISFGGAFIVVMRNDPCYGSDCSGRRPHILNLIQVFHKENERVSEKHSGVVQ